MKEAAQGAAGREQGVLRTPRPAGQLSSPGGRALRMPFPASGQWRQASEAHRHPPRGRFSNISQRTNTESTSWQPKPQEASAGNAKSQVEPCPRDL